MLSQEQRLQRGSSGDSQEPTAHALVTGADELPLSELNLCSTDVDANASPSAKNQQKCDDDTEDENCGIALSTSPRAPISQILIYPSVLAFVDLEIGKTASKRFKVHNTSPINTR